jgi:hypothetical protein
MPVARRSLIPLFAALALVLFLSLALRGGRSARRGDDLALLARRGRELAEQARQLYRREMEKVRIADALSRGRMGLLDAAACWRALYRRPPIDWERFREAHAGGSDEERLCRAVIEVATGLLSEEDPCRAEAFRAGLERELDGHLARGPQSLSEPGGAAGR